MTKIEEQHIDDYIALMPQFNGTHLELRANYNTIYAGLNLIDEIEKEHVMFSVTADDLEHIAKIALEAAEVLRGNTPLTRKS